MSSGFSKSWLWAGLWKGQPALLPDWRSACPASREGGCWPGNDGPRLLLSSLTAGIPEVPKFWFMQSDIAINPPIYVKPNKFLCINIHVWQWKDGGSIGFPRTGRACRYGSHGLVKGIGKKGTLGFILGINCTLFALG